MNSVKATLPQPYLVPYHSNLHAISCDVEEICTVLFISHVICRFIRQFIYYLQKYFRFRCHSETLIFFKKAKVWVTVRYLQNHVKCQLRQILIKNAHYFELICDSVKGGIKLGLVVSKANAISAGILL